ncbi:hypothetical protein Hanom_Chr09g00860341 [Helianthus anomalus]
MHTLQFVCSVLQIFNYTIIISQIINIQLQPKLLSFVIMYYNNQSIMYNN